MHNQRMVYGYRRAAAPPVSLAEEAWLIVYYHRVTELRYCMQTLAAVTTRRHPDALATYYESGTGEWPMDAFEQLNYATAMTPKRRLPTWSSALLDMVIRHSIPIPCTGRLCVAAYDSSAISGKVSI